MIKATKKTLIKGRQEKRKTEEMKKEECSIGFSSRKTCDTVETESQR